MNPEQPFYGLHPFGFEKGTVPHTGIEDMAGHYIKGIRIIQSNGPYFIGGSGGGCAAVLEIAHQLESQGQDLGLIALLTPTPLKPAISYTNLYTFGRLLRYFFHLLIVHLKSRPLIPALYNAFSNRVLWHFRIFHRFIPIDIHRWRRFIEVFSKARMRYEPKPYKGRITCLLRDEFSHNPEKGISDWCEIAVGGLNVRFVPGNIFTMWKEPHVEKSADQLQVCLDAALKDSSAGTMSNKFIFKCVGLFAISRCAAVAVHVANKLRRCLEALVREQAAPQSGTSGTRQSSVGVPLCTSCDR